MGGVRGIRLVMVVSFVDVMSWGMILLVEKQIERISQLRMTYQ
jgi:hypothetical protein